MDSNWLETVGFSTGLQPTVTATLVACIPRS
jgi:hypothetical protein